MGLPGGTVTCLFTDIEGSTRLLQRMGPEPYGEALAAHRRVLRQAFTAEGGVEVDTQGDSFFGAFPTVSGAAIAAENAHRALASGPITVRMGLHTGTPVLTDEGYMGIDVHRGARIAALAHGGQVIVSEATAELLKGRAAAGPGTAPAQGLRCPDPVLPARTGRVPAAADARRRGPARPRDSGKTFARARAEGRLLSIAQAAGLDGKATTLGSGPAEEHL